MVGPIVLVRGRPDGGACCVGAWFPPCRGVMCRCVIPPWWGVLCWRAAHLMVGRAALLWGPPYGGACCVGVSPASWWGVRCWCLPAAVVVRGVVVLGLGCRCLCCLPTSVVGFELVVF